MANVNARADYDKVLKQISDLEEEEDNLQRDYDMVLKQLSDLKEQEDNLKRKRSPGENVDSNTRPELTLEIQDHRKKVRLVKNRVDTEPSSGELHTSSPLAQSTLAPWIEETRPETEEPSASWRQLPAPITSSPLVPRTVAGWNVLAPPETGAPSVPAQGLHMHLDDRAQEHTENIHGDTEPERMEDIQGNTEPERTENVHGDTESPAEPSTPDISSVSLYDALTEFLKN